MIILDTNIIDGRAPSDRAIELLAAIALATDHTLGLPVVVWDEYMAHYDHELAAAHGQLQRAIRTLREEYPAWPHEAPSLAMSDAHQARNAELHAKFTPLRTPEWAGAEALKREAIRAAPASGTGTSLGSGAATRPFG